MQKLAPEQSFIRYKNWQSKRDLKINFGNRFRFLQLCDEFELEIKWF